MSDMPNRFAESRMRSIAKQHESDAMTLMELGHSLDSLQIVVHANAGREAVTTKRATEGMHRRKAMTDTTERMSDEQIGDCNG